MTESSPKINKSFVPNILRTRTARLLATISALLLSVAILGYLVYRQRDILLNRQWYVNPTPLVFSFICFGIAIWLGAKVWVGIVNALGHPISFRLHFRIYCLSLLTKRLPGTVWYVAYRAQMYEKEGMSGLLTSLASGIELVITIISGIIVSIIFAFSTLINYRGGMAGIAILSLISLGFLHPRVIHWLIKKFGGDPGRIDYWVIFKWVWVYIVLRILGGAYVFGVIKAFYPLQIHYVFLVIGLWSLVGVLSNILIFAPTNLGFTEVSMSLLLTTIIPSSIAVIVVIVIRITSIIFEIIWSILSLGIYSLSSKTLTTK